MQMERSLNETMTRTLLSVCVGSALTWCGAVHAGTEAPEQQSVEARGCDWSSVTGSGRCGFDRLRSAALKGRSSGFKRVFSSHLRWSERKESSTAGSASIRSPSVSMPRPSSGLSDENGSISKPGTHDSALVISLDSPEESPETHSRL